MKVLLIEDDAAIAGAIVDSLEAVSWDVVREETGQAGLARISAGDWDVILLDLGLPDMDGIEVARRAPRDPDNPHHRH